MARKKQPDIFTKFTSKTAGIFGHAWVFVLALAILLVWAVTGPFLGFSNTWQLIINTGTTIITFLMVFIIQNTQNRDTLAMNIKFDSIMRKLGIDSDDLLEAEEESDKDLQTKKKQMQKGKRRK